MDDFCPNTGFKNQNRQRHQPAFSNQTHREEREEGRARET
jgi:hypothetical protein